MNRYKVVSLFSGCGGMDLGFIGGKHNFEIVWANDNALGVITKTSGERGPPPFSRGT